MFREKSLGCVRKEVPKEMIGEQVQIKHFLVLIVLLKVFPADLAVVSGFIELSVCVNICVFVNKFVFPLFKP